MRERIAAAFIVLALAVLVGAGAARSFTLRDLLREQEVTHLTQDVRLVGRMLEDRREEGLPIDRDFLVELVPPETQMSYTDPQGRTIVVVGQGYRGDPDDDLSATDTNEAGTLELGRENKVVADIVGRDVGSLIFLFLLIALVAGVAGWLAARALSAPFRRLAIAAGALGRGRFDLDLPPTKIPEAQAIAQSLRTSALQLEARLSRERAFAEHASHVLRTPLTSLRLELEDLAIRRDVTSDVREAAQRCMACVDAVNTAAGELVALTRRGSLVEGSELTLHDLATELAQRWADRLAEQRRTLSAAVEGDLEMVFTPGPVEHVLDLVLADVVQADGRGPVRITFHGEHDHLRVRMPAGMLAADNGRGRGRASEPGSGLAEARALAESQGGRVRGDGVAEDLEILLPRR